MSFPGAAQKAVMSYFYKTFGQNMQGKPTNKHLMGECHLLFQPVLFVIFVIKRHRFIVNGFDSVITDRNFVSISPEIFHHRLWTSKGSVGKNNPRLLP